MFVLCDVVKIALDPRILVFLLIYSNLQQESEYPPILNVFNTVIKHANCFKSKHIPDTCPKLTCQ